jgi:hypothetical protein
MLEKFDAAKLLGKFFLLFTGGLYCFGFGLSKGKNFYGEIDNLLPLEWVLLCFVGVGLLIWACFIIRGIFKCL